MLIALLNVMQKLQLDFLPSLFELEILPDWTFYHNIYIVRVFTYISEMACFIYLMKKQWPRQLDMLIYVYWFFNFTFNIL